MQYNGSVKKGNFMKRLIIILLSCLLPFAVLAEQASQKETERDFFDSKASYNRSIRLPNGKQLQFYAQNSPEWAKLYYTEKPLGFINFGDGGCVPTALANALINLVDVQELPRLRELSRHDYMLDSMAVNARLGKPFRSKFVLDGAEDYTRFLPLVLGQYFIGNNPFRSNGFKSTSFYKDVMDKMNLHYEQLNSIHDADAVLARGGYVITSSGGWSSPISQGGHYFLLVSKDSEYVYFLDSLVRQSYKKDFQKIIEIVEPGLVRVRIENIKKLKLNKLMAVYSDSDKQLRVPMRME